MKEAFDRSQGLLAFTREELLLALAFALKTARLESQGSRHSEC